MKKKEKPVEETVEELGCAGCYTVVLSMLVWGELRTWADWRDSWALLTAPEEKKRLALEVARCVPDAKEGGGTNG